MCNCKHNSWQAVICLSSQDSRNFMKYAVHRCSWTTPYFTVLLVGFLFAYLLCLLRSLPTKIESIFTQQLHRRPHANHGRLGPAAHLLGSVLCLPDVSQLETQLAWSYRGNKRPLMQRGQQYQLEAGSQTVVSVPGTGGWNSLKLRVLSLLQGTTKKGADSHSPVLPRMIF